MAKTDSKYKVGDKVEIVANNSHASSTHNGKIGYITKVYEGSWGNDSKQIRQCGKYYYDVDKYDGGFWERI